MLYYIYLFIIKSCTKHKWNIIHNTVQRIDKQVEQTDYYMTNRITKELSNRTSTDMVYDVGRFRVGESDVTEDEWLLSLMIASSDLITVIIFSQE